MTKHNIFNKILTIGPDIDDQGGMASVLQLYRRELPEFHYLRSNSRHGTIAGIFPLLALLLRIPIERAKGRKIMHVHTADGKSFIRKAIIIAWGRLWGFKAIYHCHGAETKQFFERCGFNRINKILGLCSGTIVLSQSWADWFNANIRISPIYVLPNIVTTTGQLPKQPYHGVVRLLFMGAIGDRKGLFDLLDIIGENAAQWRGRLHLTVGGDGEMDRYHKTIHALGIEDMVTYIGWATGAKKDQAFKAADVAILPSYNEGLPIFILEAMADGMPIISTFVGGIAEIVDDSNGFLTNPGDKSAITKAITAYLDNPTLIAQHGNGSLAKIAPYYPANVQAKLEQIYNSLL
jgi:glycosyltransferase involved in cell wall biosynthesis